MTIPLPSNLPIPTPTPKANRAESILAGVAVTSAVGAGYGFYANSKNTQMAVQHKLDRGFKDIPSPEIYLRDSIRNGISPQESLNRLASLPPVFNPLIQEYEDYSHLGKTDVATFISQKPKTFKNYILFEPQEFEFSKSPKPQIRASLRKSKAKETTNATFDYEMYQAPALTADSSTHRSDTPRIVTIKYSSKTLDNPYSFSQVDSFSNGDSFSEVLPPLDKVIFYGPPFFRTGEGIFFFFFFATVLSLVLYYLGGRNLFQGVIKYITNPRLKLDILRRYSQRELSYNAAKSLLIDHCGVSPSEIKALLTINNLPTLPGNSSNYVDADYRSLPSENGFRVPPNINRGEKEREYDTMLGFVIRFIQELFRVINVIISALRSIWLQIRLKYRALISLGFLLFFLGCCTNNFVFFIFLFIIIFFLFLENMSTYR